MAKKVDVARTLADHERRLAALEALQHKGGPSPKTKVTSSRATLPQHIIKLRDAGFFTQPRTADDVHKKLLPIYHSEVDRVAMALLRLATKRKLRKATKKSDRRQYQAYVW
jgi:hypothetical protein